MSVFADQASGFATSDRQEVADQLLDVACREAIGILQVGREHGDRWAARDAELVLAKAQGRAGRVLGQTAGVGS